MRKLGSVLGAFAVLAGFGELKALVIFDSDATIDYTINEGVNVVDGISPPTMVDVLEPAYISSNLGIFDSSIVNIEGGAIVAQSGDAITVTDSSTLNIEGGSIVAESHNAISAYGASTVNLRGGSIESSNHEGIYSFDSSTVNIYYAEIDSPEGDAVRATGSSTVNIYDVSMDPYVDGGISSRDFATVNVYGGRIPGYDGEESVRLRDSSIVNLIDGVFEAGLDAYDSSTVNILGGSVDDDLTASTSATVNISAGSVHRVIAWGSSQINLSGGTIRRELRADRSSRVFISGGVPGSLKAGSRDTDDSIITVSGHGFNYPYGEILASRQGWLTGTLSNGDPIYSRFEIQGDSAIVLIPEPAAFVLFCTGAAGLMAYALWRRREYASRIGRNSAGRTC